MTTFPTRPEPVGIEAADVIERAGVSYRQLDYWTRAGHLPTTTTPTPGTGTRRRYPVDVIHLARLMGCLTRAGFSYDAAADLAKRLHYTHRADLVLDNGRTLRLTLT